MRCWHSGSEVIWNNDYDLKDIIDEEGILTALSCSNDECGASYECVVRQDSKFDFMEDNKPKLLPKELLDQLQWAKNSLVGKTFMNKKTKGVYYVKEITVDTETLELRVIYVDGVSINEWDRPLSLFIEKFVQHDIG